MTKQKQTGDLIVVLPGDDVTEQIESIQDSANLKAAANSKNHPKIGTGLRYDDNLDRVYATCAGRLQHQINGSKTAVTFFVQHNIQRYRPSLEDRVVGIVEDRAGSDGNGGDLYRVNIGGPHPAVLSNLSFEGATKRNKPQMPPGTLLYGRVSALPRNMDPILSCQLGPNDAGLPRKDWMTNEGAYGTLQGGTCQKVSLGLARQLLHPDNVVLQALAQQQKASLSFEMAVGVNGSVWVHSNRPEHTILIQNAIVNSEVLTDPQVRAMVRSLMETISVKIRHSDDHMDDDEDQ